jgi:hypothetical protein
MFVITKLLVDKEIVEIDGVFENKELAFASILEKLNKQTKTYINKIKDTQSIQVYTLNEGYVFDTKTLSCVYQVLQVPLLKKKYNVSN